MITTTLDSTTGLQFTRGFPSIPDKAIEYPNAIDAICETMSDEVPLVFIEGEPGCGATTLLAQFCIAVPEQCFHLFVRPASRFSYSADYLRLVLAEQFSMFLGRKMASDAAAVDVSEFDSLVLAVRKKKGRRLFYFVIDGLQQVPSDQRRQLEVIFSDVLSLGVDGFRFLITGKQHNFENLIGTTRSKTYQVHRFSKAEARSVLDETQIASEDQDELIALCRGLPGRLASVKRQLASGLTPREILSADQKNYPQFLSQEFRGLDGLTKPQQLMLAILANARYPLSLDDIKRLADGVDSDLVAIKANCAFLQFDEMDGSCSFESETHRRIAEGKLHNFKSEALDIQIAHLSSNPNSMEALQFLPAYLHQADQLQALMDMLDSQHYSNLLENTQSISSIRARAALGARAAIEANQVLRVFQFSLQRSIFQDVSSARGFQAQVAALVALGQPHQALDVASQAPTMELRLHMLAEYGRGIRESGGEIDSEILATIRQLCEKVNFSESPEASEKLAENVAFFDPDLAISIVDCALSKDSSAMARDDALLRASLPASLSGIENNGSIIEKTSQQFSDERLRSLISFITGRIGNASTVEICTIAETMQIDRRIYFLRSVLGGMRDKVASLELVEYALNQVTTSATYLPKIKDFVDFSKPLAACHDNKRIAEIVKKIEGQLGLVDQAATSADISRLQMQLARAEASFDIDSAKNRIIDRYLYTCDVDSYEAKAESLAVILHALTEIDSEGAIEASDKIGECIKQDLVSTLDQLLARTASHFEVVRSALGALARFDIETANELASRLNTQYARDSAYKHIMATAATEPRVATNVDRVLEACDKIANPRRRDEAILSAIESSKRSPYAGEWLPGLMLLLGKLTSSNSACYAAISLLTFEEVKVDEHVATLLPAIRASLDLQTSEVERLNIMFRASAALARHDLQSASTFYGEAEDLRLKSKIVTAASEGTIAQTMSLLVRASRVLIKSDELTDDYLARFVRLCGMFPNPLLRMAHLADLASKAWCENRSDLAKKILQSHCRAVLDGYEINSEVHTQLSEIIFAPTFLAKGAKAFELLQNTESRQRDGTLYSTVLIILRKLTEADPWSGSHDGVVISLDDAEEIVSLIEEMSSDFTIYSSIRSLTDAMLSRRTKYKVNINQRAAIRSRLEIVVRQKLPDLTNIKHQGYSIAGRARLARLTDNGGSFWNALRVEAFNIPNVADRVLVLLDVAECMPARLSLQKAELLESARKFISDIPSAYDRVGRLNVLIDTARDIDPLQVRSALRDAFEITFELDSEAAAEKSRRQLLDLADQIDPKLVDILIEAIDDDPARAEAKAELVAQSKVQKARRRISDPRGGAEHEDKSKSILPSAAWKTVTSLVSGRGEPIQPDLLLGYVSASGDWDLHSAFPILSWYVENLSRRLGRPEDVLAKLSPIWEVLLLSTELAITVIGQATGKEWRVVFADERAPGVIIGRVDGRDAADTFMRSWLRNLVSDSDKVVICDPYFGVDDVGLLRIIMAESPHRKIVVLTSRKAAGTSTAEDFLRAWTEEVDLDPPEVEVISVSDIGDERSPVHDRWLIVGSNGLRFGTSFSGFGNRLSEISELDAGEAVAIWTELRPYAMKDRVVSGRRINYSAITF